MPSSGAPEVGNLFSFAKETSTAFGELWLDPIVGFILSLLVDRLIGVAYATPFCKLLVLGLFRLCADLDCVYRVLFDLRRPAEASKDY